MVDEESIKTMEEGAVLFAETQPLSLLPFAAATVAVCPCTTRHETPDGRTSRLCDTRSDSSSSIEGHSVLLSAHALAPP
jgi:hypothetical protein